MQTKWCKKWLWCSWWSQEAARPETK